MRIQRRYVGVLAVIIIAIVSLAVAVTIQNARQQQLMEQSFTMLGRFPDAIAVNTRHEDRRVTESYVTSHSPDEIRAYYDQRLHEMSWQGASPEWTSNGFAFGCYIDPTGAITARLGIRTVPSPGSSAYSIELARNGCTGPPG